VRNAVRSLTDHHHDQLAATDGAIVYADAGSDACPLCSAPMRVQKTTRHVGKTLAHGQFVVCETIHACSTCKVMGPDGKKYKHLSVQRQHDLATLLLPNSSVGYDVMCFVGRERYNKHRQREEIQGDLLRQYSIDLSTGEISNLERSFTVYLRTLHETKAGPLKAVIDLGGGYALHIDATCETGRGTIFVAYCGWRQWVLGAWKIPTERADAILPKLQGIEARFGAPRAIMRDLGRAVGEAAKDLVGERDIKILECHMHFLKDIGKDLLAPSHDKLRELFRQHKVRANLASHARKLGRVIGTDIGKAQEMVNVWLQDERHQAFPEGMSGIAVVRALAQWVLDYAADGPGKGFPFERPMLYLYNRSHRVLRAVESLLQHPSKNKATNRALASLHTILIPVRSQVPQFEGLARTLESRAQLFDELRDVLKLKETPKTGAADTQAKVTECRDVEAALGAFEKSLRRRRPERGPAQDMRDAIDTILTHIERHGPYLSGHEVKLTDGSTRLVDRTNVILERLFGHEKRRERRRSGRKNLTQDLEQMPAEAFLALNLEKQEYLDVVCGGSIDNLPGAFAALDAGHRSQALPVRLNALPNKVDADIVSSSLPKPDRNLVRTPAWNDRVLAEAKSRAPLRQAARKRGRPTAE
jgi:hypothetical protein